MHKKEDNYHGILTSTSPFIQNLQSTKRLAHYIVPL